MKLGENSLLGEFTFSTLAVLKGNGWNPDRIIETKPFVDELEKYGFEINPVALECFARFGGRHFRMPAENVIVWFNFDFEQLRHSLTPTSVKHLAELIGEISCPVGSGQGYNFVLCPSGKAALLHAQWYSLHVSDSVAGLFDLIFRTDESRCKVYGDVTDYQDY